MATIAPRDQNFEPSILARSEFSSSTIALESNDLTRSLKVFIVGSDGLGFANKSTVIDESTSGTTYIGKVAIGSVASTSSAIWQIERVLESGTTTTISFAGGSDSYNQVWDDRASLTYT